MARPLTSREKRLAIMFGAMLFVLANLIGVVALLRRQEAFAANLLDLRNERVEQQSWLSDSDFWRQRREWLGANLPVLKSAGEANAELLDTLTTSAAKHSITVLDRGFAEPDAGHKADYQQIVVKLKVSGAKDAVTQWLWEVQQPGKFQGIPSFSMKLDSEGAAAATTATKIVCELVVARYYAPAR